MTLSAVLRRMGRRELTAHGFRSTFRDRAADNGHTADVAEAALAHTIGDKTRSAYERTDLFNLHQTLMDEWATFVTRPAVKAIELQRKLNRHRSRVAPIDLT